MLTDRLRSYGRSFYTLFAERRKAERIDFACALTVSCKDRYGQMASHSCSCKNISPRGMALDSPEPIAPGTGIYIHSETHNVKKFARVCYCNPRAGRHEIGCQFTAAPEYWN